MRHLSAKIMVSVACAIILLHAIVPHHHHDCCGAKGFVFETEVTCHCDVDHHDVDHHHSHHPFDICWLQDMLSHLVIASYDETNLCAYIQAEVHNTFVLSMPPVLEDLCTAAVAEGTVRWLYGAIPLTNAPRADVHALRAPPCVA